MTSACASSTTDGDELEQITVLLASIDVTGDLVACVAEVVEDLRGASAGLRRSSSIATMGIRLADAIEACMPELPAELRERIEPELRRVRAAQGS